MGRGGLSGDDVISFFSREPWVAAQQGWPKRPTKLLGVWRAGFWEPGTLPLWLFERKRLERAGVAGDSYSKRGR